MPGSRGRLWIIPTLFLVVFGSLAVSRHQWLASWAYDLGIKSQVLYNCAAGRWLESSFEVQNYFGDHFNPTFLLLTPLWAVLPAPITLIVLQCACVAVGGLIVGLLAARWLPEHGAAAPIAQAVFLLHPSTGNMVLYDFHENALAGTLILASVLMLERRHWLRAGLCLVLAAGCKENGGLAVAALGTWMILRQRSRGLGAWLIPLGLAYSYLCAAWIMPQFRGGPADTLQRYAHLGSTPADILANLARSPQQFAATIFQGPKLLYVLVLLLPTLFVPLLAPKWLIPAGWVLLPNLLSNLPQQYSSLYQYDALVMPFVVLAMLRAWCALGDRRRIFTRWMTRLTVSALVLASANSRIWFWAGEAAANFGRLDDLQRIAEHIPPDAPLSASMNLGPHLIRRQLLDYPNLDWPATRFPNLPASQAKYVLVDYRFELRHRNAPRGPQHRHLLRAGYTPIMQISGFALYEMAGHPSGNWSAGPTADQEVCIFSRMKSWMDSSLMPSSSRSARFC
jgi:uncharacterized membrane protein